MARQIQISIPVSGGGAGGAATWGTITGTLSDQQDLATALATKADGADTYTKAQINSMIGSINQFEYIALDELPTASADTMYKIYLIPNSGSDDNVKDEYITLRTVTTEGGEDVTTYSWELLGTTQVDLSSYQKTYDADATKWDTEPTYNSNKPVLSKGIYDTLYRNGGSRFTGASGNLQLSFGSTNVVTYELGGDANFSFNFFYGEGGIFILRISKTAGIHVSFDSAITLDSQIGDDVTDCQVLLVRPKLQTNHVYGYVLDGISTKLPAYTSGSSDWDTTPTQNSTKPVTSGGIYSYVNTQLGDINTALEAIIGS